MALSFTGIVFLDRNGFLLFSDSVNKVLQFNFAPHIIRDLEVIDHEMLQSQIGQFFTQAGLKPFQGVIILSENLLFEKPFTSPQDEGEQQDLNIFLENLPFEHVGSIIYTNEESKFIATNKDLYQALSKGFEKMKCTVESIVPSFILGFDINQMLALNAQTASDIYRKALSVKQYSFLKDIPPKITPKAPGQPPKEKESEGASGDSQTPSVSTSANEKNNTRVFVLIGVFLLLLGILGFVIFTTL